MKFLSFSQTKILGSSFDITRAWVGGASVIPLLYSLLFSVPPSRRKVLGAKPKQAGKKEGGLGEGIFARPAEIFGEVPAARSAAVNFVQNRFGFGCINAPVSNFRLFARAFRRHFAPPYTGKWARRARQRRNLLVQFLLANTRFLASYGFVFPCAVVINITVDISILLFFNLVFAG